MCVQSVAIVEIIMDARLDVEAEIGVSAYSAPMEANAENSRRLSLMRSVALP